MHKDGFSSNFLEKAHFIVKMTGLTMVQPASLTKGKHPKFLYQRSVIIYLSIYFGHNCTDLRSLSHSRLLAMTGARSCLERLVSLSSRSMTNCCWVPPWVSAMFWFPKLGNSLILGSPTVAAKLQPIWLLS